MIKFEENKKTIIDLVKMVIRACREEGENIMDNPPFMDNLLQGYDSEEKVY